MTYKTFANGQVLQPDDANLLMRQGLVEVPTVADRDKITNRYRGMMVEVYTDKTSYRWTGDSAKWHPWNSAWRRYYPAFDNVNLGGGSPYGGYHEEYYRWEQGMVRVKVKLSFGNGASIGGEVRMDLPEPVYYNGFNSSSPYLEGTTIVRDAANGRDYIGGVQAYGNGPGMQRVRLMTTVSNDTFAFQTTFANAQPINPSMYSEFWCNFKYESYNYPFDY